MVRLVLYLIGVAALAAAFAWLADRPGTLLLTWQGYEAETSVFRAVVLFASLVAVILLAWSLLTQVWSSPALVGRFFSKRRRQRGLDALSSGMIAVGAGDPAMATHYALQARRSLPNEPLTHLLRAQAAQLSDDKATARRIFEAMLASPDTEQLGLRGLFIEAEREGETEAARQFAGRALRLNAKLAWPVEALFELMCRERDWAGALEMLAIARRSHAVSKPGGERRRAVLLTAQAQKLEESEPDRALGLALEAHGLAPDLVPAAVIAGRLLAGRGNTPRAARVVEKTWMRSPHPDLAIVHAHARVGDSPRDRLARVRHLASLTPNSLEGPIAIATEAIHARAFDDARRALEPLLAGEPTQRVCLLMARIEGEEHGDKGRIREWLARTVAARRDPVWIADGVVSEDWAPVSPVTGTLDAFQWRVPVEELDTGQSSRLADTLEQFAKLGAAHDEREPATPLAAVLRPRATDRRADAAETKIAPPGGRRAPQLSEPGAPSRPSANALPAGPQVPKGLGVVEASPALPARAKEPSSHPGPDRPKASGPVSMGVPEEQEPAAPHTIVLTATDSAAVPPDHALVSRASGGPDRRPDARTDTAIAPYIFVPPPAPDDPGPEPSDFEDDRFRPGLARPS